MAATATALVSCVSPPDGSEHVRAALSERGVAAAAVPASEAPATTGALDEDALVALALRNNAGFRAALADLGIAEAEWLRAGGLPPVSFSMLFPLGPKQLEYAAKFPVDVIWLRPKRVAAAKRDWEATAQSVVQYGLDLVRDVRVACADRAAAQARLELASHNAESFYVEFAEKRFRAGALAENDVTAARARAAAASDRAEREQGLLLVAEARIAELVGVEAARPRDCGPRLADGALAELPPLEELLERARAARPDLRAAELALEAAGERAGLARREIFQLIAVFDANGSGDPFEAGPGIELPIPLDGGRATRRAADARLEKASASYQAALARVLREVREAHAQASAAARTLRAWSGERLPELEAWRQRAEAAYAAGGIDRGALLEATIAHDAGALDSADAQFAWRRAHAELERAVGGSISRQRDLQRPLRSR